MPASMTARSCWRASFVTFALALGVAACARSTSTSEHPSEDVSLVAVDGHRLDTAQLVSGSDWTVLVFISRECPCVAAHNQRLGELAAAFAPRVKFVAIDSEVGGTPEIEAAEIQKRRYPFPIFVDTKATLANRLGAEYATYTVIMNRAGEVLYRGGLDSDKVKLHDDATLYVRDALTDLTTGKPLRRSESTAVGCSLHKS